MPERPKGDDRGQDRPAEYHRKSDIEKHLEDPIRALAAAIESYGQTELAERKHRNEDQQRSEAATERRHHEQVIVERFGIGITTALTAATLAVLVCTLRVYNRQASIMQTQATIMATQTEIMRSNELPYVGLGNRDGSIGKILTYDESRRVVELWFFNSGRSPALDVNVVATSRSSGQRIGASLARYSRAGSRKPEPENEGSILPPQGSSLFLVPGDALPLFTEFKGMPSDDGNFDIRGFIEYCDQFGGFHCDGFAANYAPKEDMWRYNAPPICDLTDMSPPTKNPDQIPLPRCKQPSKRNAN